MSEKRKISIIAPCRNEERFVRPFLNNMLSQDYPKENMELLVIDGNSTDSSREIVKEYCAAHPFIKLIINEKQTVPFALNKGIVMASGDYIVRTDLHAIYPKEYLSTLIEQIELLNADNVGGVCLTLPAREKSVKCKAIATVISNRFGVGNSYFRIGSDRIMKVDTVPFGCFRKELFGKIGLFDEELTRNQDDEFNGRIIREGGSIYLIPSLRIKYYARDSVAKVSKMFYQYGLFKPLVNRKLGSPATLRQFVPIAFLFGLFFGGILSFFSNTVMVLYFTVLSVYILLSFCFTRTEIKKDFKLVFFLPWLFPVIHLSYAWGYFRGIIRFIILKKNITEVAINR